MTPTEITIKKAHKKEKKQILAFYKENNYPASFIGYDHTYLITLNNRIIGSVIISYQSEDYFYGLLHGLLIAEKYRGRGYATLLLNSVFVQHQDLLCFADKKLSSLYTHNDFILISSEELPHYFRKRYESYVKKHKELSIFIRNNQNTNVQGCISKSNSNS